MEENLNKFLIIYLFIFMIFFFIGACTAFSKRGRYLDKSVAEISSITTFKIGFSIVVSAISLYGIISDIYNIDWILMTVLSFILIIVLFTEGFIYFKIYKISDENANENSKNANENSENANENSEQKKSIFTSISSEGKDMLAIAETTVCNGMLSLLIFIIISLSMIYFMKIEDLESILLSFHMCNIFLLVLFNSLMLLIFSIIRFIQYMNRQSKKIRNNTAEGIIKFLDKDVKN